MTGACACETLGGEKTRLLAPSGALCVECDWSTRYIGRASGTAGPIVLRRLLREALDCQYRGLRLMPLRVELASAGGQSESDRGMP